MLELYIDRKLADWGDDVSIDLVKELGDTDELTSTQAEYSYEITLPASITNNNIFSFKNEIDVADKFSDIHIATLYNGGVELFDGNLLLTEIDKDSYKCNLYKAGKKPLKEILGDKQMKDITPHYKYVSTYADIQHINWYHRDDAVEQPYDDKHIAFPYILYNLPYNQSDTTSRKDYQQIEGALINDENSYPTFSVTSLLTDVFASYGYTVNGNIFTDDRFTNIYQTIKNTDWNTDKRKTPCYLNFQFNYDDTLSDSCYVVEDEEYGMNIGTDSVLKAGNGISLVVYNDTNNMMTNSTINIPRSGWYRVKYSGGVQLENRSNVYAKNTRRGLYFPSANNTSDPTNFTYNPLEIKLMKSGEKRGYVSSTMSEQYKPWMKDVVNTADSGVVHVYSKGRISETYIHDFPTNEDVMKLESDDLISGVRVGAYRGSDPSFNGSNDFYVAPNRRKADANVLNLPSPSITPITDYTVIRSESSIRSAYDVHWYMSKVDKDNGWQSSNMYDYDTAFSIVNKESLSNHHSDTYFNSKTQQMVTSGVTKDYSNINYPTIHNTDAYNSTFSVDTVVYLKKGEKIEIILTAPYADVKEKDGDYKVAGMTSLKINNFQLEMGLVNDTDDEYWRPSIDQDFTISPSSRLTNVNALLGTDKCQDWLTNICTTFNLKVTRQGDNAYSIDTQSDESIIANTISIDEHVHHNDSTYKRIDLPSDYKFQFTNKDTEYLITEDSGNKTYNNPNTTSGDEKAIQSKYSFNVYTPIEFEGIGAYKVPVICNSERYTNEGYTYAKALSDGDYVDGTPRLMYLPSTATIISDADMPLLIAQSDNNGMTLDFDSISSQLFKITFPSQYEVEVEMFLPQSKYMVININTVVKFNGNLYRISKVDGYDVTLTNKCKLTLTSM